MRPEAGTSFCYFDFCFLLTFIFSVSSTRHGKYGKKGGREGRRKEGERKDQSCPVWLIDQCSVDSSMQYSDFDEGSSRRPMWGGGTPQGLGVNVQEDREGCSHDTSLEAWLKSKG